MSLVWFLRLAKTYEHRFNLVKAIYEIQPNYETFLLNLGQHCSNDEEWKLYDEVEKILNDLQTQSKNI